MNARFLLLPALAFGFALTGCDSGAPTDGLQTTQTIATASSISGPTTLRPNCTATYSTNSAPTGGYFSVLSGPGSVSPTFQSGTYAEADLTRTAGGSAPIVLAFHKATGVVLFQYTVENAGVRCPLVPGPGDPG